MVWLSWLPGYEANVTGLLPDCLEFVLWKPSFSLKTGSNGASRSYRLMGARPSGRFSVNEPTRLELTEGCGKSGIEAA
jgi:hypothetical protein